MAPQKQEMNPAEIFKKFVEEYDWDFSLARLSEDEKTIHMYSFGESNPPRTYHGLHVMVHV